MQAKMLDVIKHESKFWHMTLDYVCKEEICPLCPQITKISENLSCLTLSCTFTTIQVQLFVDIYKSFMCYTLSSKMKKEAKVKYLSYIYLSYLILNLSLNLFDNILIVSVIFNAFSSYIILEGSKYILSLTFLKIQ